jgi:hypothetical protein
MNIRFRCPTCDQPARLKAAARTEWQCPACDHRLVVDTPADRPLETCAVCGNVELYRKKDFPHWLGLTILTVACVASVIPYWLYMQWLTWTILIGSAAFDGILYLLVGDVVVCYRCDAHYRGLPQADGHKPFDLGIAERYRQERLRREHLQGEKRP